MKTLVLLSGGLDSAVVLAVIKSHVHGAVGFDYGQSHSIELEYAEQIAKDEGVPFEVVKLPYIPKINDIVFAGRNAVLLSAAAGMAQAKKFDSIAIGCNASDRIDFPDCRFDFLSNLSHAFETAYGVRVLFPLINYSKREVVEAASKLGVSIKDTYTCYKGGTPCGECYACKARKAACSL